MPTAVNKHPLPQTIPVNSDKLRAFRNDIQQEQEQSAPAVEQALLAQQNRLAAQAQQNGQNPYGTAFTPPSPNGVYPSGAYPTRRRNGLELSPTNWTLSKRSAGNGSISHCLPTMSL
ncbi:MAG TPA: hypothetical protein VG206_13440 [Terriglobia bacterium]|nr:hypothetical protein [Terriglobia bacterium]